MVSLKLSIRIIFLSIFLFQLSCATFGQKKINQNRIEVFEQKYNSVEKDMEQMIDSLIAIAKDEQLKRNERRAAIFLLGKIKREKSIRFLLENVEVYMLMKETLTDEQQAQEYPYYYALEKNHKYNWNLISCIFDSLKKERSRRELLFYKGFLYEILGSKIAKEIVGKYHNRDLSEIEKINFEKLKAILK